MWSPGAPHLDWQPMSASRDYRGLIVGGGDQEFQVYMPDISEWCLCLLRWFVIAYSFVTLVVIMPIVGWSDGALPVSVLPVPPRPSGHISHRIRSLLRELLMWLWLDFVTMRCEMKHFLTMKLWHKKSIKLIFDIKNISRVALSSINSPSYHNINIILVFNIKVLRHMSGNVKQWVY